MGTEVEWLGTELRNRGIGMGHKWSWGWNRGGMELGTQLDMGMDTWVDRDGAGMKHCGMGTEVGQE